MTKVTSVKEKIEALLKAFFSEVRNFLRDVWNDSGWPTDMEYYDPVTRDKR